MLLLITTVFLLIAQGLARDDACAEDNGFFADENQCDAYHNCVNGTAKWELCPDGLAFLYYPRYTGLTPRCDFTFGVDCSGRPKLQEPQPTRNCPRKWGMFKDDDCNVFWYCVNGTSYKFQCPPTLAFNDEYGICDHPRYVARCQEPTFPVTCPKLNELEYLFNPHPILTDQEDCSKFYICMNGKYPRSQGCPPGTLFNDINKICENETLVICNQRPIVPIVNDEEEYNENALRPQGRSSEYGEEESINRLNTEVRISNEYSRTADEDLSNTSEYIESDFVKVDPVSEYAVPTVNEYAEEEQPTTETYSEDILNFDF